MAGINWGRILGGAVAAAALTLPASSQAQVNQVGKWTVAPGQGSPLFFNYGPTTAKVMVTVCMDSGVGVDVNVVGGTPATALIVGHGVCRTAIVSVPAGGSITVTGAPVQASGTYGVSSPLP